MSDFIRSGPAAINARAKANAAEQAYAAQRALNAARLANVPHIDRTPRTARRITLLGLLVAVIILAIQFIGLPYLAASDVATTYRVEQSHKASASRLGIRNGNRVTAAWEAGRA